MSHTSNSVATSSAEAIKSLDAGPVTPRASSSASSFKSWMSRRVTKASCQTPSIPSTATSIASNATFSISSRDEQIEEMKQNLAINKQHLHDMLGDLDAKNAEVKKLSDSVQELEVLMDLRDAKLKFHHKWNKKQCRYIRKLESEISDLKTELADKDSLITGLERFEMEHFDGFETITQDGELMDRIKDLEAQLAELQDGAENAIFSKDLELIECTAALEEMKEQGLKAEDALFAKALQGDGDDDKSKSLSQRLRDQETELQAHVLNFQRLQLEFADEKQFQVLEQGKCALASQLADAKKAAEEQSVAMANLRQQFEDEVETLEADLAEAEGRAAKNLTDQKYHRREHAAELKRKEDEIKKLRAQLNDMNDAAEVEISTVTSEVEDCMTKLIEQETYIAALGEENSKLKAQLSKLDKEVDDYVEELSDSLS